MDSAKLREYLVMADQNVRKAKDRVRRQGERVKELAANGRETKTAQAQLQDFENLQTIMETTRDIILEEVYKNLEAEPRHEVFGALAVRNGPYWVTSQQAQKRS